MLTYSETPVQEVRNHPLLINAGIRLLVKREDLNHTLVAGNKWWKLKYNLEEAIRSGHDTLLTFGGAYSNHIYATAAAARIANLKSIGIIRGEEALPLNRTLAFAADNGMILHYLNRSTYREKQTSDVIGDLRDRFGNFYLIPEGGTNALAVKGCEGFAEKIDGIACDYICLAVGTGGTLAGIARSLSSTKKILGIPVLKNAQYLEPIIAEYIGQSPANFALIHGYDYGGYGKRNETVTAFIREFAEYTNIPLDFVYTGKLMCAVFDLIKGGYFQRGNTILVIHTGGLQGH